MASRRFRIEFTVDMDCWDANDIEAFAIQELASMSPYPRDIEFSEVGWHTGTPAEEGWYLVAYKKRDCDGSYFWEYGTRVWIEIIEGEGQWNECEEEHPVLAWQKIEEKETCFAE